jgi:hypothetical protein
MLGTHCYLLKQYFCQCASTQVLSSARSGPNQEARAEELTPAVDDRCALVYKLNIDNWAVLGTCARLLVSALQRLEQRLQIRIPRFPLEGLKFAKSLRDSDDLQALREPGKTRLGHRRTRLHSVLPCRSETASPEGAGPQIVACGSGRVTRTHAWDGTHGAQGFSECESSSHRCGLVCVNRVPGHPGTSVCTTTGSPSEKRPVIAPN